jgi:DNA-directed RNA polymerase subunit RPC12/RpoP
LIGVAVSVIAAVYFVIITLGLRLGIAMAKYDRDHRISKVGVKSAGGLACPKCGGVTFKSKRSAAGKVGFGLLAAKTRVRCETCGAQFTPG